MLFDKICAAIFVLECRTYDAQVVRTFTLNAAEQKLCKPTSLCAHGRLLYVLNLDCPRVDVFA